MSNLVIVVQRFSPYNKVGARRWSKFVHYLQNYSDLNITVITQKHNNLSADPWNIDLRSDKIKVEYVNDPLAVIASSLNIFKRLSDFFRYKVFKHTDEGYGFSKRAFLHLEKNEQRLMPDVVIASSPSYSTCYFAAKYRKKKLKD